MAIFSELERVSESAGMTPFGCRADERVWFVRRQLRTHSGRQEVSQIVPNSDRGDFRFHLTKDVRAALFRVACIRP